ncbi:MAG: glucosamine-6-phosphate deaminase [Oligosphaeraceae bacterium]|nr:glucosamine-6-phosphate deaminase [Oligosphaeraceae bacterium]
MLKFKCVPDYQAMSAAGAEIIYQAAASKLSQGQPFNLGLATGNTMLELYRILAEMFNRNRLDLTRLQTWNLDEYALDEHTAVPPSHPLSYWKYMHENLFDRLLPERNFREAQAHFPDPAAPADFDRALAAAGGLDLQLLGIGFNGHIAFNEPMPPESISATAFAALPTRVIALAERTIAANAVLTANGSRYLVPRYAATMGMQQILSARQTLLLACFAEQQEPLTRMLQDRVPTPALPASFLLSHPDFQLIYTADKINLKNLL